MKKLLMIASACLMSGMTSFGQNEAGKPDLRKMVTLETSKEQVTNMLGAPESTSTKEDRTMWLYRTNNYNMQIVWNETNSQMEQMTYSSKTEVFAKWTPGKQSNLEIDKTGIKEAIKIFGEPKDMVANHRDYKLNYKYDGCSLLLYFREGVLAKYEMIRS